MSNKFDPVALSDFARYYGFHYDRIDSFGLIEDVLVEMQRGLDGRSSSLPMIPAYISFGASAETAANEKAGKTVIALDAGGTNLRSALVQFDQNGKVIITDSLQAPMPGTYGRLDEKDFFSKIADVTTPLIKKSDSKIEGIGFCFSYPMEITKEADGILLALSKEVDAPEVIGKPIGKSLKTALSNQHADVPEKIVLLNDTVATLLSGMNEFHGDFSRAPLVGFILGTGFNTAYLEKRIDKIGFDGSNQSNEQQSRQIVVCESGNFAHRYMGFLDREYDATTKNSNSYSLEKAASGAYLGPLTFHIIKQAIRDGVFSFSRMDDFLAIPALQTKDLNAFLTNPHDPHNFLGSLFGADEQGALSSVVYLASIVTERAALLSAAMVAAAVEKSGDCFDPFAQGGIAVEGTTYIRYSGMRRALESYLHVMLNRKKPRQYTIAPVQQASLLGAAAAALS
ncbi:MAG: hexokinase [Treponema sp.]|jgi:hexokinase|nr:hexokinase [Treponema sp.]